MKYLSRILGSAFAVAALSSCAVMKTPQTSSLFEPYTDPESGVVSYVLKYGAPDDNRQSLYFVTKSMTEDGRFLVFMYTEGNETKGLKSERRYKVADLKKDKVFDLCATSMTPYIDVKNDYMVYGNPKDGFFRRYFAKPDVEEKLCDIPAELSSLGEIRRLATHLTLTIDRSRAFLDTEIRTPEGNTRYIQGMLNLNDGTWDEWGETKWCCNHGQLNPINDDLAMCAWESAWSDLGKAYQDSTGLYPRMWLVEKGKKTMVPSEARNFSSHEIWDDDGKGISWCGHGKIDPDDCVYHMDLATGHQEVWARIPGARHNNCSPDNKYVVADQAPETWWRGCKWRVAFYNRETDKLVWVYSTREPLRPQRNQSVLHPDPHPHFVMNGRYVICTANNADGHMDLFVTPVDQLIEMTK